MALEGLVTIGEIGGAAVGAGLWVSLASLTARRGQTGRTLTTAMVAAAIIALLAFSSYQMGTAPEEIGRIFAIQAPFLLLWLGVAHWRFRRQAAADQPAARASSSKTRKASASSSASRVT